MKQFKAEWQKNIHDDVIATVVHFINQHNALCDYLGEMNEPLQEIEMPRTITLPKPEWWEGLHNFREEGYMLGLSDTSKALGVEIKLED